MATSKYTTRDALSAILSGEITEDTLEWARKEIEALDARNAKAKEKAAEKREADLPMLNSIMEALPLSADEPITAAELAEMLGITTAKVSSLMKRIIADGAAASVETKSKSKSGGKCKGYFRTNAPC
jgi:CRP-like cAMP-binding protein